MSNEYNGKNLSFAFCVYNDCANNTDYLTGLLNKDFQFTIIIQPSFFHQP
jgi:hypothetical protein